MIEISLELFFEISRRHVTLREFLNSTCVSTSLLKLDFQCDTGSV